MLTFLVLQRLKTKTKQTKPNQQQQQLDNTKEKGCWEMAGISRFVTTIQTISWVRCWQPCERACLQWCGLRRKWAADCMTWRHTRHHRRFCGCPSVGGLGKEGWKQEDTRTRASIMLARLYPAQRLQRFSVSDSPWTRSKTPPLCRWRGSLFHSLTGTLQCTYVRDTCRRPALAV